MMCMAQRGNRTRQIGRMDDADWALVAKAAKIKKAPNTAAYAKHAVLKAARRVIANEEILKRR